MVRAALRFSKPDLLAGYGAAALAAVIWASYPIATRAGVTGPFEPPELMLLRFGVGALVFLPYLATQFHALRSDALLRGVPLTLFQGAGMAALVIFGLQFAPASHAAALGPGVAPMWIALFAFLLFSRRPSARSLVGAMLCATGAIIFVAWGAIQADAATLFGDAMFIGASGLGALYVLQLRRWGIGAIHGAAIVTIYSAAIVVPWYLWSRPGALRHIAPLDLLWQALWQGVLIGCIALVALNHAINRLGPERASALVAAVPALSAMLGMLFLGEVPSSAEAAAILVVSAGVSLSATCNYAGSPAISRALANRSA